MLEFSSAYDRQTVKETDGQKLHFVEVCCAKVSTHFFQMPSLASEFH